MLKGFITIERIRDNQIVETITQENVICQSSLVGLLGYNAINNYFGQRNISISTQTNTPDTNNNQITQIIATGSVATGVTSPEWFEGVIPPFGQVKNRFAAPVAPRSFSTIGLTNAASNNNQNSITATAFCYVKLDLDCTQTSLDTLDITYRIQFQNDSDSGFLNKDGANKDYGKRLFGRTTTTPGFNMSALAASPFQKPVSNNWLNVGINGGDVVASNSSSGVPTGWDNIASVVVANHFKFKFVFNQLRTSTIGLGRIFNLMLQGSGETVLNAIYSWSEYFYDKSPFQLGFWHSSTSTNPFFDANALGSSKGIPRLSGTWTGGFPQLFKINIVNITTSNTATVAQNATSISLANAITFQLAIGTNIIFANGITVVTSQIANVGATTITISPSPGNIPSGTVANYTPGSETGRALYTWSVRKHLGFNGATYTDLAFGGSPFRFNGAQPIEGIHGWTETDNDVLRFSDTQIVQYDQNGVTILNLVNGEVRNFDTTTNPSIGCNDIRQCATDGTTIYVACRNTGIWVINTATNTVTNPIATGCYGVDIGRLGVAWAIFNGSLRNSTNWATAQSFTFTGLTDNNWTRARFLKCDPGQTDDQIAIVADNGAGVNRVIWYRSTGAVATLGFQSTAILSYPANLDVSDVGGFWAIRGNRLNFGAATVVTLAANPALTLTSPIYGTGVFHKVSFFNNLFIGISGLITAANTVSKAYTALPDSSFITHVSGGIVIGSRIMRQLITDNSNYENYGWNGSQWDTTVTTPKQTHSTVQSLGFGISIAFENGATTPSFFSGDYFTQGLNFGLWKSNASDIFFTSAWYSKPVVFNFLVQAGAICSSGLILSAKNDPNFQRIETDSKSLSKFTINGLSVANVYFNGELPGVNEVTINGITGIVTFNAADLNKPFGGTYAFIKFA